MPASPRFRRLFLLGSPPPALPSGALWTLNTLLPAKFYQDSGLTTPVAANADPVGGIVDANGNLLQATSGKRPTWRTNAQNGQPVLRGDKVAGAFMAATFGATIAIPYTAYWLLKWGQATGETGMVDSPNGGGGTAQFRMFQNAGGLYFRSNSQIGPTTVPGGINNWHLYQIIVQATSVSICIDGGTPLVTTGLSPYAVTGLTLFSLAAGVEPDSGDAGLGTFYGGVGSAAQLAAILAFTRYYFNKP